MCFSFTEAMARSLAPVNRVNAIRARLRISISVAAGHDADNMLDLLHGRRFLVPLGGGDTGVLIRQIKILGIRILNTGLVARLS